MTVAYKAEKRGSREIVALVAWRLVGAPCFRLIPLPFFGCRCLILRMFGAKIGKNVKIYPSARIWHPSNLRIADSCGVGEQVYLYNKEAISIGEGVVISRNSFLCTASHDYNSAGFELISLPIRIEPYAWLASQSTVLPGVAVGEGAVLAACAVLTRNADPWCVYGGNPARKIKTRKRINFVDSRDASSADLAPGD